MAQESIRMLSFLKSVLGYAKIEFPEGFQILNDCCL